jgi:hypothetical protein
MMAYHYANIKKYLHGIVFKGRLAYAMRAWSDDTLRGAGEFTGVTKAVSSVAAWGRGLMPNARSPNARPAQYSARQVMGPERGLDAGIRYSPKPSQADLVYESPMRRLIMHADRRLQKPDIIDARTRPK